MGYSAIWKPTTTTTFMSGVKTTTLLSVPGHCIGVRSSTYWPRAHTGSNVPNTWVDGVRNTKRTGHGFLRMPITRHPKPWPGRLSGYVEMEMRTTGFSGLRHLILTSRSILHRNFSKCTTMTTTAPCTIGALTKKSTSTRRPPGICADDIPLRSPWLTSGWDGSSMHSKRPGVWKTP